MEDEPHVGKLAVMIIMIDGWIAVYRSKAKDEKWKKDRKHLEQLSTGADFQKLDNSEYQSKCRKILNTLQPTQKLQKI